MALAPINVPHLFFEGNRAPFSGRALQLGRQAVFFNREELVQAAELCDFVLQPADQLPLIPFQFGPEKQALSDIEFFKRLGFDTVDSLDFNDLEENNIIFDLNSEETPPELTESYDLILDGGTLEHIFHVPNCLKNIHRMLKTGGRVIHVSPASNFFEHGFYSFSPCFFIDYYTKNGYDIPSLSLLKFDLSKSEYEAQYLDLFPNRAKLLASLARIGGLDGFSYMLAVVAQKRPDSTCGVVPIQGHYEQRMAPSCEVSTDEQIDYSWKNGKWDLPWKTLPCLLPPKSLSK